MEDERPVVFELLLGHFWQRPFGNFGPVPLNQFQSVSGEDLVQHRSYLRFSRQFGQYLIGRSVMLVAYCTRRRGHYDRRGPLIGSSIGIVFEACSQLRFTPEVPECVRHQDSLLQRARAVVIYRENAKQSYGPITAFVWR